MIESNSFWKRQLRSHRSAFSLPDGKSEKDKYRVWLYFVTLGKVSSTIRKHAFQKVKQAELDAHIELIDGRRAMLLFRDYLDGVAPPIPTLDLELEQGAEVTINGVSQRFDIPANLETWCFFNAGRSSRRSIQAWRPKTFRP